MRRAVMVAAALAVGALGIGIARDPAAMDRLAGLWDGARSLFSSGEAERVPNWGDVAEKIGDFAREERGLTDVLSQPGAPADPPPAQKQP